MLGHLGATLGHLGTSWGHLWAILGPSWDHHGAGWAILGPSWGHPGTISGHLGPSWGHLGLKRGRSALGQRLPGICKPILDPLWGPKLVPKLPNTYYKIGSIFASLCVKILKFFKCLLAIFLAIPRLSWMALDPTKLR
jgi:hypothetical protein